MEGDLGIYDVAHYTTDHRMFPMSVGPILVGIPVGGTLNVKLGGKNMTFYQRITAVYQGSCKG